MFTRADSQGANREFRSDAPKGAVRREPASEPWLSVTAKNAREYYARRREASPSELNLQHAFQLRDMPVGDFSEGGSFGGASRNVAAELGSNTSDPAMGGPRPKMAGAAAEADSVEQLHI